MNVEKKVSIIVAIYKSERFLDKLITSIVDQTYHNLEIILVDDGSPDNSGKICDKYALKDDRIKVIHKINGGACEARNYGLKASNGDYVVIVDGDDWLSLDYVEYMMMLIETTGSEMALSDKLFTTRDQKQNDDDFIETWTPEKATAEIIYPHMEIGPWNKIYSSKLIKENNISFSVPWSGEGLYFASTAAQYANHVGVGHKKVYNYRLNNENSGLTNYNVQMGINALYNIKNIEKNLRFRTPMINDAAKNHIWRNYYFLLFLIFATNSKEKYKKEYKECRLGMFMYLPHCLIHSEVGLKYKLSMIRTTLLPVAVAKKAVKKSREALKKDNMK